jgi:cell division protein FtsI (penicillin-binding protein 3)
VNNLDPRRQRWMRARMGVLLVGLTLGASRLVHAAWQLQRHGAVRMADGRMVDLSQEARNQYAERLNRQPRRGTIFDRHRNPLAVSVPTHSLYVNPRRISELAAPQRARRLDASRLAERLAGALHMDVANLRERVTRSSHFVWVKRDVSREEREAVQRIADEARAEAGLRAADFLGFAEESRRWYPQRETVAHITGFVNAQGEGMEGVERRYDERLRGRPAQGAAVMDARRNVVFADGVRPGEGQSGDDVVLTIDSTIQMIAARELAQTCQMAEAAGGSVIVMEPRTGEVLAMASYPTFNPNDLPGSTDDARRNRAIADRFEPGSTLKVFSVGGALDAGVIQPGQLINCYGGSYSIGRLTIHDSHPETWLTPMQVLARSSNIGAAQIGAALGSDGLERAYRRFGFGDRTGVQLPAESPARFGQRRWYEVEVATVAFGQGIGVTAMQLAQGLNAVANGGRLVRPLLVSRVTDATGAVVEENLPEAGRVAMQPGNARLLREMLTSVTEEGGTGTSAAIPGVRVAGKTGTAQKANESRRGYDDSRWVSSFIGFAPANQPRLVITVVIDEPQMSHAGGEIAAPLFRRVMEQSLRYLGALPATARTAAEPAPAAPTAAPRPVARVAVTGHGVPDLHGMTVREAMRALGPHGLEAAVEGSGVVVSQEPAAGAPVVAGQPVRLRLEPAGPWAPAARGGTGR